MLKVRYVTMDAGLDSAVCKRLATPLASTQQTRGWPLRHMRYGHARPSFS